ncbi:hypothetical protein [Deinococcus ruber]|uniref:DUF4402 domain-containing protein n=1 Tax=Deinococcus ruber TaxID=1848197 RepID=A0A918FGD6_9DEIO|nr:hypothetical protein [Deinococcus ruber]GGR36019.1 hypothetical protein GCM10008957_52300 [Deinococcus ruber]
MKRTGAFSLCLLCVFGVTNAQFSTPSVGISLQPTQTVTLQVARQVRVQPQRLEMMLAPGHTTGTLTFTVFSEVPTEIFIRSSSPQLVSRSGPDTPIVLAPYSEQNVSLVALAAHSGTLTITNKNGEIIDQRPYIIAPAKVVYQGASLNYSPSSNRVGLSYTVSGVTSSPLDPIWSAGINMGINTHTQDLSGGVNINVNW